MNILFQSVPCLFCWISRNPSLVKTGGPYVSPNVDLCFFEIRRIPDIRESAWYGLESWDLEFSPSFFPTKHKMENKFSKLSGMSRHFKGPTKCRRLLSVKQASIIRLDMIGLKSGVSPIERSPFSHDRPGSCGLQPLTLLLCQEPSQGWPRHVAGVHSPARKTLWLWPSLSLKFQHQGRYEHP